MTQQATTIEPANWTELLKRAEQKERKPSRASLHQMFSIEMMLRTANITEKEERQIWQSYLTATEGEAENTMNFLSERQMPNTSRYGTAHKAIELQKSLADAVLNPRS